VDGCGTEQSTKLVLWISLFSSFSKDETLNIYIRAKETKAQQGCSLYVIYTQEQSDSHTQISSQGKAAQGAGQASEAEGRRKY